VIRLPEIRLGGDLEARYDAARILTADLSHDYILLNAVYHS